MKKEKPTQKQFYQHWSREQLIKELCRINQSLIYLGKGLKKVEGNLKKM